MLKVTLHIQNPYERRDFDLDDEVTIGRTDASSLVVSDSGLSRRNTTVFRDGSAVIVVDEGSLNGTFLNGNKVSGATELRDGDELKIGTETRIRIEISEGAAQRSAVGRQPSAVSGTPPTVKQPAVSIPTATGSAPKSKIQNPKSAGFPLLPVAIGFGVFAIFFFGATVIFLIWRSGSGGPTPGISHSSGRSKREADCLRKRRWFLSRILQTA